jgi:small subunit ribosomal protein S15
MTRRIQPATEEVPKGNDFFSALNSTKVETVTKDKKDKLITENKVHPTDTGSAEVQVALLSQRITQLTDHLKLHPKDHSSRRGLLKMVGKRSALLKFLARQDRERYLATIGKLGLRK